MKSLDANAQWTGPELAPKLEELTNWDVATWEEINQFGQEFVLPNPEQYSGLLHVTKTVPLGDPVNKSIVYEIVDICHRDWGSDHAFVWMPKEECLLAMAMQSAYTKQRTYASSAIRAALMAGGNVFNAFPSDLMAVWKDIQYKYLTTADVNSAYGNVTYEKAKLTLPSVIEVIANFTFTNLSARKDEYKKEGTTFKAFASNDFTTKSLFANLIRKGNGIPVNWWNRSLCSWDSNYGGGNSTFFHVSNEGRPSQTNCSIDYFWVCPCFAV